MKKQRSNLIELTTALRTPIDDLIGHGADGQLKIGVIAKGWLGKKAGQSDTNVIVDGEVELLPSDLIHAYNADEITVSRVKTAEDDVVLLNTRQKVMRGNLFVTAEELERVQNAPEATSLPEGTGSDRTPPYLDPLHGSHSEALEAAVSVWMALYAEGGFEKKSLGDKDQIRAWLKEHRPRIPSDHARDAIAQVVNPNKKGGNPRTKK